MQPADFPLRAQNRNRSAQVVQIDSGKHVAVVAICALLCGAASIYAWRASEKADRSEERADLLQYYVMELDGKLMKAGVLNPSESWSARQAKESE
jgi:hypothetical protein